MKVQRVEKHVVKSNHPYYQMLDEFCFKSKNLYNFANYQIRQKFCSAGEFINYNTMDKLLKQKDMDLDYRNMPAAQSAQQCLRMLEKNWKSFFVSVKDYKKNQSKYTGRPKLPKYLDKNGRNILILTNKSCKVKDGLIKFPKTFNGFTIKTNVESLQQVRILPRNKQIVVEVIYNHNASDLMYDNGRYLGIDIGLDNLATIVNNVGYDPIVVNGKGLKSMNKYYNKQISHYREIAKRINKLDYTKRMNRLTIKRNNKIDDFMHKASKFIVDYALGINCNTIIIGNNKDWKRESKMSKKVNQSFVGIPHQGLIEMIEYKCENVGINLIITEESYTSGTSFLDGELPIKESYDKSRRKHRGLFTSDNDITINADVNGAYQIMKKVSPNLFDGVEGVGLHPFKVNIK